MVLPSNCQSHLPSLTVLSDWGSPEWHLATLMEPRSFVHSRALITLRNIFSIAYSHICMVKTGITKLNSFIYINGNIFGFEIDRKTFYHRLVQMVTP